MHSDTHVALAGKVAHFPVELGGDASRGAWAEPDMDAFAGGALPLTVHIEHAEQARLTVFYHARVHRIRLCGIGTDIHDDPGKAGTNTTFLYCLGNAIKTITMGKHRFEERGGTRFQHFRYTQARAYVAIVLSKVALQDPDTIT